MAGEINPEKRWVKPSSFGGGTTGVPVVNRTRPGAGGARTGGITDRNLKTKPYNAYKRFKGKAQIAKERLEGPETPARPRRPIRRGFPMGGPQRSIMPGFGQPMMGGFPQAGIQPGMPIAGQMPSVMGAPMAYGTPQSQFMMPQYQNTIMPQYGQFRRF